MINWAALPDANPSEAELAAVSEALRSPDPVERDGRAYPRLIGWVPGLAEERRLALGDVMAARFEDPEIQARTFAPLVLGHVVKSGALRPAWSAAFARWYPAEADLRGHHPELGWLHSVAHGADLLAAFGQHPAVDPEPLLALGAARLLAPTGHVFDAMEDDRLGFALGLTLTRPELTERQSIGWLDAVAEVFAAGEPGPVPAEVSNTLRTLRVVHLLTVRGVRPERGGEEVRALPHGAAVGGRIVEVLSMAGGYLG
ncbi:DUF2785 domain-containing protein [Streptomyces sp. TLI_171]|uniref:DUF2785 domain-containing protein n=1 Tax=Streptomyces sp. TLI_171 TaxID=1938859 RepID=UPI000C17F29A|nr:DUF2785 domain-containing protein [Streptomyces sp. TLI_171]RKE19039.1 uncharacterized protein DUF2785 [Streptomyces sp. TLI_171]